MDDANALADIDAALEAKRAEIRDLEMRSQQQESVLQHRDRSLREREEELARLRQTRDVDTGSRRAELEHQDALYRRKEHHRMQEEIERRRIEQMMLQRKMMEEEHRRHNTRSRSVHPQGRPIDPRALHEDPRAQAHFAPPAFAPAHAPPAHPQGPPMQPHNPFADYRAPPPRRANSVGAEPSWWDRYPGYGVPDMSATGYGPVQRGDPHLLRPDLLSRFPVVTTDTVPGFHVIKVIGPVSGSVIRPVHAEIDEHHLGAVRTANEQGRKLAMQDMIAEACFKHATAITGLRFDSSAPVSHNQVEVLAYGTAVLVKPVGKGESNDSGKKKKKKKSTNNWSNSYDKQDDDEEESSSDDDDGGNNGGGWQQSSNNWSSNDKSSKKKKSKSKNSANGDAWGQSNSNYNNGGSWSNNGGSNGNNGGNGNSNSTNGNWGSSNGGGNNAQTTGWG